MILFNDWKITCEGNLLAMQYDHLSRWLQVKGTIPEGYDWAVLVRCGDLFDIIPLEAGEDGLSVRLTAQQLSQSGSYTLQLRGMRGEEVCHTNRIAVFVGASLSGQENWPEIPSAFTQLEQRVYASMHAAADSERTAAAAAAVAAEILPAAEAAREYTERMEAVRDALTGVEIPVGDAAIELLAESGILTPAYEDGAFYTDETGAIYIV